MCQGRLPSFCCVYVCVFFCVGVYALCDVAVMLLNSRDGWRLELYFRATVELGMV